MQIVSSAETLFPWSRASSKCYKVRTNNDSSENCSAYSVIDLYCANQSLDVVSSAASPRYVHAR